MADIETSIGISLDTSNALAAIKNLQREISAFHTSLAKGSAGASNAAASLQKDLIGNINATGQFSASMTKVRSTTEAFTNSLEKNKFSMGEYFRYAGGASKTFGKNFSKEFNTIEKVARERVKDLQTQFISMGRDANGALQAIKVRPMVLDLKDAGTQMQITAQKQQIFNQLLKQGSTNLLNFGKNTQWAGRQLMVGFTLPLTIFGQVAAKTFMDLEKQALRFRRVYGELFTSPEETESMIKALQELSLEFTKYGVAVEKTMELAADAAAMGETGAGLLAQVTQANRLAVLGNVEQSKALETTISVTNAFAVATEDLAGKIDFLNAVENQTVTSIEDLTIAIPKAGPVVKQLGGDVEDLAFFLTAMKEGGINASEGANALKSGLAALINPTGRAADMLAGFGININKIVQANKGDVRGLVTDFAEALDVLDPLNRAQAIEQLFGKFQFSRLSTLFQNVIAEGTQAERVLDLANSTVSELAALSNKELGNVADSTTFRFQKSIEELRAAIAPVGEQFLKAITPIIEFATKMLNSFNSMNEGVKNFVVIGGALLAGIGPVVLMAFGLLANGVANLIKGFAAVRGMFLKTKDSSSILGEQMDYMTQEQLEASSVAASLERVHQKLEQRFTSEAAAVENLVRALQKGISAQRRFNPQVGAAAQAAAAVNPVRLASGTTSVPGPKGAGDIVPALLSPGEAVIPAKAAQKYAPIIEGMIAGNIPGFAKGVMLGMPGSGKSTEKNRTAADQIYEMFLQSSYRDTPPTNYGHQLSPTSGHSFPIFGLGGVYMGPGGKKVFVKPVMDEKAALAEIRGTQIARQAHGLEAPEQRIVVIKDPQDVTGTRKFLALESELDAKFINNDPNAVFNEEQYFRQLVASLVRVDKDLAAGNMFGNVVADVGPAGVFNRASGIRDYQTNLPSMEDQAMINLLGIKGGAKRAFAESTLGLMSKMNADQYHQYMIAEIQRVLPSLKQTVAGFGLTNPQEADAYSAMIKRLETGLSVDWRKFHSIHSAVKVSAPKQTAKPVPVVGYANGVVSVPGPKGKGDVVPAMLSPGEAVIPAKEAKKYAPLINGMIAGNIPGYKFGKKSKGEGGRPDSFKTFTEFTALFSDQANTDLMLGKALPSSIAGELNANPEAIQGPLIAYLAEMLRGATTQVEIEKALNSDPSIEAYARALSLNIAKEVSGLVTEQMADADLVTAVQSAVASTPSSPEIQGAVQQLSTRQTTYEEDTVERLRSNGRFQPMGRERLTSDRGRYTSLADRGRGLATRRYGDVLSNPVAAHLTAPMEMPLADFAAAATSKQAQEAAARKARKEKEIRIGGTPIVIPQDATPQQKRDAVAAGKKLAEDVGEELLDAAQVNSPSKKTKVATQGMVDGVVETLEGGKAKVGKAAKGLVAGSTTPVATPGSSFSKPATSTPTQTESFRVRKVVSPVASQGPEAINVARGAGENSMGPLKAYFTVVGANLREVVQEFKTEVGIVSSDSMGPLQAYLTTVKSNLREAWTESKAEFGAIFSGADMSAAGKTSAQRFREGLESANPQVMIEGKEMGINFAAALAGRQGGIEAVLTKKNAELVSAATRTWNAGIRELPKQGASLFKVAGGSIVEEITKSTIARSKQLGAVAGDAIASNFFNKIPRANLGLESGAQSGESSSLKGQKNLEGFQQLNSQLMTLSFAFSSIATVTSMFGEDLGFINDAIYGFSNGILALTGIIQLLTIMKGQELKALVASLAATIANTIATTKETIAKIKNATVTAFSGGIFSGFGKIGGKLAGLFGNIVTKLGAFLPAIGFAIAAFAVFKIVADLQEKQKQKIEGLGNAASLAGDKLTAFAALSGFTPTRDPSNNFDTAEAQSGTDLTAAEATQSVNIASTEQFKTEVAEGGQFYQDVQNLKDATVAEAQAAMSALMIKAIALAPEGTDISTIKATVAAIAAEAGQTGVSLELPVTLNPFESGNEKKVLTYLNDLRNNPEFDLDLGSSSGQSAVIATTDQKSDANQFGAAASASLEQLNTQLLAGELTASKYNTSVISVLATVKSLGDTSRDIALLKMFEGYGVPADVVNGITDLESKLLLLRAYAVGAPVQEGDAAILDAADNGTEAEKQAGLEVEARLREDITTATNAQANAVKDKAKADKSAQAALDLSSIEDELTNMEKTNDLLPDVASKTESLADAYEILANEKQKNILLDAQQKDIDAGGGTANFDAAMASIQALTAAQKAQQEQKELDLAPENLENYIADLEEEAQLKKDLEAAGFDAAEAQEIMNNEIYTAGYNAAVANGTVDEFILQMEKIAKLKPAETTGGTPEQTPFEKAIEDLKEQRTQLIQTSSAYSKLRKAGFSVANAFEAAKDPITAAAIATTKVGSAKWKELLGLIKQVDKFATTSALNELTRNNMAELSLKKDLEVVSKFLEKSGYSAEQVQKVLSDMESNPDVAKKLSADLKDGKVNAESIKEYLKSVKMVKVKLSIEDMESKVNAAFSQISEAFSAKKTMIELDFELGTNQTGANKINPFTGKIFNTKEIDKEIKAAEEYIAERQFKLDDNEYQLDGIQNQEDKINETYDKRLESLSDINEINSEIAEQQKAQLTLADALSSGDISAAARAAQEMRAQATAKAATDKEKLLEKSREGELKAVRSQDGRSRIQIEKTIKDLKQEIIEKEEKILEPAQRSLDIANNYKDAAFESIDYLGKNESEWKKIEAGVKNAKVEAEAYKKAIGDALLLLPQLNAAYTAPAAPAAPAAPVAPVAPVDTATPVDKVKLAAINEKIAAAERYKSNMQKQGKWAEFAGASGKLDQYYAERKKIQGLASGGFVSGPGSATSDSIFAMLSDGEYVINARTAKTIGIDMLDAINFGKKSKFAMGGMAKPKYFSYGGMVKNYANGGGVVPSMLSPKELVMSKYGVQNYGLDRMKALNSNTSNGDSVYNYEVNVSVQTDSNPDQIARAVLGQIKQIDAQRIRGNRL